MRSFISSLILLFYATNAFALDPFPPDYQKKRLIISTDIGGGDKDDTQSMIHFLVYANMFDLEGIVISRPGGHIDEMLKVLKAYKKDYEKLLFISPDFPTPEAISKVVKVGAKRREKTGDKGYSNSTSGSRLIVNAGRKDDPRPLHILVWGSITDVAQAIHDAPDIHHKLRIVSGGRVTDYTSGFNEKGDPSPYEYMRRFKPAKFLWHDTGANGGGMFMNGLGKGKYSNKGFVKQVLKSRGALGRLFYNESRTINVGSYGIKMGDTPMLLYLFNGDFDHPKQESWGGRACRKRHNYYNECKEDIKRGWYGAYSKIVDKYRVDILKDWEKRVVAIYDH